MAKNGQILVISFYSNIGSQNLSSDVSLMLAHNSDLVDKLALRFGVRLNSFGWQL
jgi:hypothetical protein